MRYFLIAILALLVTIVAMQACAMLEAQAGGGLTSDMIRVALSSAHIDTRPGSQMKLLDRTTGTWHDFRLNNLSVRASGNHATIDISVTKLN